MGLVVVRLRSRAGRDLEQVHADAFRADGLGRDAREVVEALLAVEGGPAADDPALAHAPIIEPRSRPLASVRGEHG